MRVYLINAKHEVELRIIVNKIDIIAQAELKQIMDATISEISLISFNKIGPSINYVRKSVL